MNNIFHSCVHFMQSWDMHNLVCKLCNLNCTLVNFYVCNLHLCILYIYFWLHNLHLRILYIFFWLRNLHLHSCG